MDTFIERKVNKWTQEALSDTKNSVYWSDKPEAPDPSPKLDGQISADLVIVGAGYTGLWAALQAIEDQPGRKIIVLEADVAGHGASSRNGGFCEPSLTHGLLNGLTHWSNEMDILTKLGDENLEGLIETTKRHNINAAIEQTGLLKFATAEWQMEELTDKVNIFKEYVNSVRVLDKQQAQNEINSPTYVGGLVVNNNTIILDPAKLTWGLKKACEKLGVVFYDNSKVRSIIKDENKLIVNTKKGKVITDKVIVATNAYASPLKNMKKHIIPVYDHVLMTEPLTNAQMKSIGWKNRQGASDESNQFHYYRLTEDNRILWGGWDAIYYKNNGIGPKFEENIESHFLLSDHFFESFPQFAGELKFSNRWAGPIGTTTQFSVTFGKSKKFDGKLTWVGGYTGLGVGASRFGARAALDLVDDIDNEITNLNLVQKKSVIFPPEPLRHHLINYTKRKIQHSDANDGRRGLWLGILDYLGLGFDS